MMRAAIYARMSTDKQSKDSPADQIARCREFAAARGWIVIEDCVTQDAGISGASRHNRPALIALMARIREWEVLLCWDFARLTRNEEDLGWIRNRLKATKKDAVAVSTGRSIHDLGSRVEGVIAAEYLEKLALDTHRGLRGRAEQGLAVGGNPYGYATEPLQRDAHGAPVPKTGFRWVVHPVEAEVVQRIFALYIAGAGWKEIANRLNQEGVPTPRARGHKGKRGTWSPSALRGVLTNPIYRGELVWNRSQWIRDHGADHEKPKRRRHDRPESEWVRVERPELRIVDDETWAAAATELTRRAAAYVRTADGRYLATHTARTAKRKHLLGLGPAGAIWVRVAPGARTRRVQQHVGGAA